MKVTIPLLALIGAVVGNAFHGSTVTAWSSPPPSLSYRSLVPSGTELLSTLATSTRTSYPTRYSDSWRYGGGSPYGIVGDRSYSSYSIDRRGGNNWWDRPNSNSDRDLSPYASGEVRRPWSTSYGIKPFDSWWKGPKYGNDYLIDPSRSYSYGRDWWKGSRYDYNPYPLSRYQTRTTSSGMRNNDWWKGSSYDYAGPYYYEPRYSSSTSSALRGSNNWWKGPSYDYSIYPESNYYRPYSFSRASRGLDLGTSRNWWKGTDYDSFNSGRNSHYPSTRSSSSASSSYQPYYRTTDSLMNGPGNWWKGSRYDYRIPEYDSYRFPYRTTSSSLNYDYSPYRLSYGSYRNSYDRSYR
jgi:hypothetical protein